MPDLIQGGLTGQNSSLFQFLSHHMVKLVAWKFRQLITIHDKHQIIGHCYPMFLGA
jgi:hypothetical protein